MLEHVVVVTDSLTVDGGSAKVALSSAMALAKTGLQVTVFAAGGKPDEELATCGNLRIVNTNQGDALSSANVSGALQGLWNRRAFAMMTQLLRSLDPDRTVVHVHGWTKALSSSVVASIVRCRFPLVVTLHEYFTACPTGCLYLHGQRKVCTIAPMSPRCILTNCDSRSYAFKAYRVVRQMIQRSAGLIPSGVQHFITVSPFSRRVLQPLLPLNRRFHAVTNPVDAVRGARATAESNSSFVFLGRFSAEKGGTVLAEAAKIAGVSVTFIGDGAEKELIRRIDPDARIIGWLDREGVIERLRSARAVVVPSLWYETFGLVVLEAAALGIPAIVPSGTAVADLVESGSTGFTFERGNVADLAAKLALLKDDLQVKRLSRTAYAAFWNAPPTMDAHIDRLRSTYKAVLDDEQTTRQARSA